MFYKPVREDLHIFDCPSCQTTLQLDGMVSVTNRMIQYAIFPTFLALYSLSVLQSALKFLSLVLGFLLVTNLKLERLVELRNSDKSE